jgi:hypothetical protein
MRDPDTARAKVRSLIIDGSILSGSTLVSVGAGLIHFPSGLITAGVLLLSMGLSGARNGRGPR